MATYLYRLGRLAYRRRGVVVLLWVVLLALAGVGAATLSGPTASTFSIPGTESQRALDVLDERMPQMAADNATARIVFSVEGAEKVTDPDRAAAIAEVVADVTGQPDVASVLDPFAAKTVSQDGRTAFATVTYDVQAIDITPDHQERLFGAGEAAEDAGLTVDFGGQATQATPEQSATEVIGLGVAAIVLVITFGAFLAAGLPLVTAILGVGIGMLGIQIATGFFELSSSTSTLALMLGLAVAIDYALFIVSRYRHELLLGRDGEEAAGRAVGTAGSAVVFAGLTVVIALSALSVVGIPFLTAMGLAAAGTVLVSVVIALTLLPAMLGFLGRRVLGRKARDTEDEEGPAPVGERWARFVVRRRWPVLVTLVLALGALAVPAADLELGLPSDGNASPDSTQRRAYDQVAAGFGPGFSGPLLIVADLTGTDAPKQAADVILADLSGVDGVAAVMPPSLDQAEDTAVFQLIPATGPGDTETEDLVHSIRDQADGWADDTGAEVWVTGETALGIDVSQQLSDALVPYLVVVVGLAFLLLMLVFRSILVPIKAALGFLLSVAATLGALVAVFQWGNLADLLGVTATGPIISFLPIFLVGVLFGLAMDYEVFLVTRMREEHIHGAAANESVVLGFRHGTRVVTAAAVIMVSVFSGFILSGEAVIKSMGFALAFGILVDAFVVRMAIVPAVMSLLGERAWWLPRWLDRVLPDVDVEGEKLTRFLTAETEAPVVAGEAPGGRVTAG